MLHGGGLEGWREACQKSAADGVARDFCCSRIRRRGRWLLATIGCGARSCCKGGNWTARRGPPTSSGRSTVDRKGSVNEDRCENGERVGNNGTLRGRAVGLGLDAVARPLLVL